jgi:hypothetical protein
MSLLIQVCHPGSSGGHGAQSSIAGGLRPPVDDRKDRQYAVADKFQHLAAKGVNRAGNAIEPGVESDDYRRRLVSALLVDALYYWD